MKGTDPLPDASVRVEIMVEGDSSSVRACEKLQPTTRAAAIAFGLRLYAEMVEAEEIRLGEGARIRIATYERAGDLPEGGSPPTRQEVTRRQRDGEPLLQMRDLPGWDDR